MTTGSPEDRAGQRSDLSGTARDVVQARDVSGGVHFHYAQAGKGPPPQELPRGIGHFVNRVQAVEDLNLLLAHLPEEGAGAVHVIAGTAGVGKTSLALHWAHRVGPRFPDGQLYINLRGYDPGAPVTADEALERFLRSLGVATQAVPVGTEEKSSLYRSLMAGRRLLVVLDNAASVTQVRPLLPGGAHTVVLITSRSRLSGLVVRDGARRSTVDVLTEQDAVALVRATTRESRSGDDQAHLSELARLCSYLPLALRIAAERAASRPGMPLAELIQDLRDESALWDALSVDDEDEAGAVRSVFAWSYRALPDYAARLFCLLGLHPTADFSAHAAAALTGTHVDRMRHPLDVLSGAYLLESRGFGRYQFHDLLRAYATDQVRHEVTADDRDAAIQRECAWYLHTAYACALAIAHDTTLLFALDPPPPGVVPLQFPSAMDAARWFEEERTALEAVVASAAHAQSHVLAWQLAAVLERLYASHHYLRDWHSTSLTGLEAARAHGDTLGEALMCESLGRWCRLTMQLDDAATYHDAAVQAHLARGDRLSAAKALNGLGWVHLFGHRLEEAHAQLTLALGITNELGDPYWTATLHYSLGYTCLQLDRPADARPHLSAALDTFRGLGDRLYEALVLTAWSMLERDTGHTQAALATAHEAVEISRQAANHVWEATTLLYLGKAQRAAGLPEEALDSYHRSAVISRQENDTSREAIALEGAGGAYQDLARAEDAVAFHRRAATVHRQLGDDWKLAKSLSNLADALEQADDHDEQDTAGHRREAAALLEAYADPKSLARRSQLLRRLSTEP